MHCGAGLQQAILTMGLTLKTDPLGRSLEQDLGAVSPITSHLYPAENNGYMLAANGNLYRLSETAKCNGQARSVQRW
jgi:hypothetical protein